MVNRKILGVKLLLGTFHYGLDVGVDALVRGSVLLVGLLLLYCRACFGQDRDLQVTAYVQDLRSILAVDEDLVLRIRASAGLTAEKRLTSDEVLIVGLQVGYLPVLGSIFVSTLLVCVIRLGLELEIGHQVHVVGEVVLELALTS